MSSFRSLSVLSLLLLAGCAQASPLRPAMDAVEEIRGREFVREVRNVTIDRADLSKHLTEQMVKSTPYPLDQWARILRALQLVDVEPSRVVPQLLSLYEAQVLAFYDPHSHTYYSIRQLPKLPAGAPDIADPKMLEETVMVHELTHALQDQHFRLGERVTQLKKDTDANMAYHAVLEGEAVLVMVAHMLAKAGVTLDEAMKNDALLTTLGSAAAAEGVIDPATPKYFAESLKFPYFEGLKFVVAAYKRGGWKELDRVHARPPRTTREILHPEDYFGGKYVPEPFEAARPAGDVVAVEHLGEFHWRFLVGAGAARGWVNDRVSIRRGGGVDVWTKWESPERAAAFADAYGAFLASRGVEAKIARDGVSVTATYTAK